MSRGRDTGGASSPVARTSGLTGQTGGARRLVSEATRSLEARRAVMSQGSLSSNDRTRS